MSLDKALSDAMTTIPECLAAAYIDIDSGFLLSVRTVDTHPQPVLDMVAAATADMFQGPNVTLIENHFKQARGIQGKAPHYFNEILVFSEHLIHVSLRTRKYPEHVITFVCRKSANIGMVLTKSRMVVDVVAEHV